MLISVAIPLYNEEENAKELVQRVTVSLREAISPEDQGEIVFVLDGCTDGTFDILDAAAKENPEVVIYQLSRNFGLQVAVRACLELAKGDYVIIMDGDLQDPPELFSQLLAKAKEGFDVVYAQRISRKENWVFRALFSLFYIIQRQMVNFEIPMQTGNYSCLSRRAVDCLVSTNEANPFFPGLRSWIGLPSAKIEYDRDARHAGKRKQSLWKLFQYGMDGIFNFTSLPLIVSFILGVMGLLFGFFMIAVVSFQKLISNTAILGWTSTIITVCLFSGAQLISIGILGSYIRRIFDNVQRRPHYFLRENRRD